MSGLMVWATAQVLDLHERCCPSPHTSTRLLSSFDLTISALDPGMVLVPPGSGPSHVLSPQSGEFFPNSSSLLLTANKPTQKTGTLWESG